MRFHPFLWSIAAAAAAHAGPCLKQAAALYHQGRYDSALSVLSACSPEAVKRRDSLALFQYSGMAEARLGRAAEAASDFRALLSLDSLFQFPRNEDSSVLAAFARAREPATMEPAGPASAEGAAAVAFAHAGGGREAGKAAVPEAGFAAIPKSPSPSPDPEPFAPPMETFRTAPGAAPAPYPRPHGIGLAMGAIPFGGGWLARGQYKHGLALAVLQAGGLALSLYASSRNTAIKNDRFGVLESEEQRSRGWRLTQGISLSTALGAYLFSLFASRKD